MEQELYRSGLSERFLRSTAKQNTGEVYVTLLSIDHDNLPIPIRAANNRDAITSRGTDFQGFHFDLVFPPESEERPPVMQLQVDNTSREIVEALRTIGGQEPAACNIEVVMASQPDYVELSLPDFKITNASHNKAVVTADLVLEDLSMTPYPGDDFGRAAFPGI